MHGLGIVAHNVEGAALCFTASGREVVRLRGPHQRPRFPPTARTPRGGRPSTVTIFRRGAAELYQYTAAKPTRVEPVRRRTESCAPRLLRKA